jgi:hypothetical protein
VPATLATNPNHPRELRDPLQLCNQLREFCHPSVASGKKTDLASLPRQSVGCHHFGVSFGGTLGPGLFGCPGCGVVMGGEGVGPESEYRPSSDLMQPDAESVFHGHVGYFRLWRYWLDAFDDIHWEPQEVLEFGDRFVVTAEQRGRGSGSGVAVTQPVFQVVTLRRGLVIRQEDFRDRARALEAASFRGWRSAAPDDKR